MCLRITFQLCWRCWVYAAGQESMNSWSSNMQLLIWQVLVPGASSRFQSQWVHVKNASKPCSSTQDPTCIAWTIQARSFQSFRPGPAVLRWTIMDLSTNPHHDTRYTWTPNNDTIEYNWTIWNQGLICAWTSLQMNHPSKGHHPKRIDLWDMANSLPSAWRISHRPGRLPSLPMIAVSCLGLSIANALLISLSWDGSVSFHIFESLIFK